MKPHWTFSRIRKGYIYFLTVLYFNLLFLTVNGAIAFDAASSSQADNTSSLTWSHTTSAGSDRILIVGVSSDQNDPVSTITYNGVNLTKLESEKYGFVNKVELWYLVNPSSGTHNVVVTLSSSSDGLGGGAVTYTGVDQSTPVGTAVKNNGYNLNPTVTVSSAADELVIDVLCVDDGGATITVGGGQTTRYSSNPSENLGRGSSEPGAASVTMSWTLSNVGSADHWAIIAVALKPVSGLPIKLLSFDARCLDEGIVLLEWTTASEINNDYFTVESSSDGIGFEPLRIINGSGNSSATLYYSVTVNPLREEITYYRLKQTDYDGKYEYVGLIALIPGCQDDLVIFPALTGGLVKIIARNGSVAVSVFDIQGRKVFEETINETSSEKIIDLRSFSKGIYLVSVQTGQKTFFQKIVLQ
jgi:hypothetical protein